jgi:hypothetical protein
LVILPTLSTASIIDPQIVNNNSDTTITNKEEKPSKNINQYVLSNSFNKQKSLKIDISKNTSINLGEDNFAHNSLTYKNQNRQGITGSLHLDKINSHLKTYSIHTSDTIDFNRGFGFEDINNRVNGFIWDYRPKTNHSNNILITTSYFSGKKVAAEDQRADKNNAKTISIENILYGGKFYTRAEYATSDYIYGSDSQPTSGSAVYTTVSYRNLSTPPQGNQQNSNQYHWEIGIENQKNSSNFHSMLNSSAIKDKNFIRFFSRYKKKQWQSNLSISNESNNTDNHLDRTTKIKTYQINNLYQYIRPWGKLGKPLYRFDYTKSTEAQNSFYQKTIDTFKLNGEFYNPKWKWHFGWEQSKKRKSDNRHENQDTSRLNIGYHFNLENNIKLETLAYSENQQPKHNGNQIKTKNYTLKINRERKNQRSSNQLAATLSQSIVKNSEFKNENKRDITFSTELKRNLLERKGYSPAIDLIISVNFDRTKKINAMENNYTAIMKIDITWANK